MRHAKSRHQLNRFTSWHKATVTGLVKGLLLHQSVRTTLARAKAARALAERLVSLARNDSLANKRTAFEILGEHKLVSLLFSDIGARFKSRCGGYTRIVQLNRRRGDNAKMVIWELSEVKKSERPKKEAKVVEKKEVRAEPEHPKAHEEGAGPGPAVKEKPPVTKKPARKFLGGIKNIFKKERDSL